MAARLSTTWRRISPRPIAREFGAGSVGCGTIISMTVAGFDIENGKQSVSALSTSFRNVPNRETLPMHTLNGFPKFGPYAPPVISNPNYLGKGWLRKILAFLPILQRPQCSCSDIPLVPSTNFGYAATEKSIPSSKILPSDESSCAILNLYGGIIGNRAQDGTNARPLAIGVST